MSILASLNKAYDRLALRQEAPSFGFSSEKISFILSLNPDGTLAGPPIDWRDTSGKKPVVRLLPVPQPFKRTSGVKSNFLWDKSSYVLGITSAESKRLKEEHQAFKDFHIDLLKDTSDEGLKAFLAFYERWNPDDFDQLDWPDDIKTNIKDQNIAFMLESERHDHIFLHDHPAAKQIWAKLATEGEKTEAICLVTGEQAPIARLHPSIKGVWGGQSSGGAIVSFNLDAFASYGHEQGDNAPVSEAAAFGYTTALNKYLEKDSGHRIQIGDASVVFWADASDAVAREEAEAFFPAFFSDVDEAAEAKAFIKPVLEKMRQGQPLSTLRPSLSEGVRFYVLGLAPNAARLSIRFWLEDDFGKLAEHYQRFLRDMQIEPPDRDDNIALWKYLNEIAVLGKRENIPPNLAGEWMRAILTGTPYPLTLLSGILARIRADTEINARRASIIKAILTRNKIWEAPVALEPDNKDTAYLLGRLFSILEKIQQAAHDNKLNATIRDKFYGSASANPRNVFPVLLRLNLHHQTKASKGEKPELAKYFSNQMGEIINGLPSDFPATLNLHAQGKFALGYFHQMNFRKTKSEEPAQ